MPAGSFIGWATVPWLYALNWLLKPWGQTSHFRNNPKPPQLLSLSIEIPSELNSVPSTEGTSYTLFYWNKSAMEIISFLIKSFLFYFLRREESLSRCLHGPGYRWGTCVTQGSWSWELPLTGGPCSIMCFSWGYIKTMHVRYQKRKGPSRRTRPFPGGIIHHDMMVMIQPFHKT